MARRHHELRDRALPGGEVQTPSEGEQQDRGRLAIGNGEERRRVDRAQKHLPALRGRTGFDLKRRSGFALRKERENRVEVVARRRTQLDARRGPHRQAAHGPIRADAHAWRGRNGNAAAADQKPRSSSTMRLMAKASPVIGPSLRSTARVWRTRTVA